MKTRSELFPAREEMFFLLLCALILGWQLVLPGFIGMASNGDFRKVSGPLCIDAVDHSAYNFLYFQANYVRGPNYCYDPGIPTSELAIAWIASSIQQTLGDRGRFDIRWLGAIHALLFLGFYFAVLRLIRPLPCVSRIVLSVAAMWIFADVSSIAYFNSFYSDVAAILGGLSATALALHLTKGSDVGWGVLLLFGLAALLFLTSKGQHGIYGLLPAGLAIALALQIRERHIRLLGFSVAAVLLTGAIWVLAATPDWYRAQARFNLIFFKIAKNSPAPLQDLRELGLGEGDLRYVGMHSFMPNSPMSDPAWSTVFRRRSTYSAVLKFYIRHPDRALAILWSDLRYETAQRRPVNLSNYQREYGRPAGARTDRLGSWSDLRSWLFRWWPAHILIWFAGVLVLSPWLALREKSRFRRSLAWTGFAVAGLAVAEFCFSSLADACETYRHLLMFHVFTDVTVFVALVLCCELGARRGGPSADRRFRERRRQLMRAG